MKEKPRVAKLLYQVQLSSLPERLIVALIKT